MITTIPGKLNNISEWLGTGAINFFGQPFAGKDIQASRFGNHLDAPVIGGGDILRNSDIPPLIRAIMDKGELIPSDSYQEIVLPYLGQIAFRNNPLMLSSVGRMHGEEAGVLAATEAAGHPVKAVLSLDITIDEAFNRMQCAPQRGRIDDNADSLLIRLEEYKTKTMPVLETYENMGLLVRVNASPEEDIVFNALVHALHERAISA